MEINGVVQFKASDIVECVLNTDTKLQKNEFYIVEKVSNALVYFKDDYYGYLHTRFKVTNQKIQELKPYIELLNV